jgi:hypothetical protein
MEVKLTPLLLNVLLGKGGFPRQVYFDLNEKFKKDGFNGSLADQFMLKGVPTIK